MPGESGTDILRLTLADLTFTFTSDSDACLPAFPPLFAPFAAGRPADERLHVRIDPRPLRLFDAPDLFAAPDWSVQDVADSLAMVLGSARRTQLLWRVDSNRIAVAPVPAAGPPANPMIPASIVRYCLPFVMARRRRLFLHAAAAVIDGAGWLFAGRSESGKSTIARLLASRGGQVLSDEHPLVRWLPGAGASVHGSPWPSVGSRCATAAAAPLKGICFLEKAAGHSLTPCPPGEALSRLRSDRLFFFPQYARSFLEPLLETLDGVLTEVPAFVLGFRPTPDVMDVLRQLPVASAPQKRHTAARTAEAAAANPDPT